MQLNCDYMRDRYVDMKLIYVAMQLINVDMKISQCY